MVYIYIQTDLPLFTEVKLYHRQPPKMLILQSEQILLTLKLSYNKCFSQEFSFLSLKLR